MKKLLLLLIIPLLFSCNSEKVVSFDVLKKKKNIYYFESEPYTGFAFEISEGIRVEEEYKDGIFTGSFRTYYENGQLEFEHNKHTGEQNYWDESGKKLNNIPQPGDPDVLD